jgi:hypothetical protein
VRHIFKEFKHSYTNFSNICVWLKCNDTEVSEHFYGYDAQLK